jgi:hypothetical protein
MFKRHILISSRRPKPRSEIARRRLDCAKQLGLGTPKFLTLIYAVNFCLLTQKASYILLLHVSILFQWQSAPYAP